jgi:hypothetical protein
MKQVLGVSSYLSRCHDLWRETPTFLWFQMPTVKVGWKIQLWPTLWHCFEFAFQNWEENQIMSWQLVSVPDLQPQSSQTQGCSVLV